MRENVAKFPTRSKAFTIFAMPVRASQRALGISMKLLRRQFLQFAVGGCCALPAASRFAFAQSYASQPVRMIVGFPAGQAADSLARIVAQALSQRLVPRCQLNDVSTACPQAVFNQAGTRLLLLSDL